MMSAGLSNYLLGGGFREFTGTIGMEVETSFINRDGVPATTQQSQEVFKALVSRGWSVVEMKNSLITIVCDCKGNKILYELGRQNLEVSTGVSTSPQVVTNAKAALGQVYATAAGAGLQPFFGPILETEEDLLIIPDERDAMWLQLDGHEALKPLAKISAVQFTVEVPPRKAHECLNKLGNAIKHFLSDYPQEEIWREYIHRSHAGYRKDRYGGPLIFDSLNDYIAKLSEHDFVKNGKLVPFTEADDRHFGNFLRSVWWYFRLRRYDNRLCIEVRPLARRGDEMLERQLAMVLDIINL